MAPGTVMLPGLKSLPLKALEAHRSRKFFVPDPELILRELEACPLGAALLQGLGTWALRAQGFKGIGFRRRV